MPENENQYELDHDYAPLGIVDAADGSGTTWPEFVGHVDKMDNQVAALTEVCDSQSQMMLFRPAATMKDPIWWNVYTDSTGNHMALFRDKSLSAASRIGIINL